LALGVAGRSEAKTPQPLTRVAFRVPAQSCDCHVHIFGDPRRFPFSPNRTYTPNPAPPEDLARMQRKLGVQRVVIVTPSAYGTDNRATFFGVAARGRSARAVVVIDPAIPEAELDEMENRGARGARLFFASGKVDTQVAIERFERLAARLRNRSWHIQIFGSPQIFAALKPVILDAGVPVVIDHFGGARGELGIEQPGFAEIVDMVGAGAAYVKLSAPYRLSKLSPAFDDMVPLARALISANPDRMLWATDWPHTAGDLPGKKATDIFPFIPVDDGSVFNLLAQWAPDPALRHKVLVTNPAHLYGF
jgi:predicted TIM-barrel fold metal-dependent hydrolase